MTEDACGISIGPRICRISPEVNDVNSGLLPYAEPSVTMHHQSRMGGAGLYGRFASASRMVASISDAAIQRTVVSMSRSDAFQMSFSTK